MDAAECAHFDLLLGELERDGELVASQPCQVRVLDELALERRELTLTERRALLPAGAPPPAPPCARSGRRGRTRAQVAAGAGLVGAVAVVTVSLHEPRRSDAGSGPDPLDALTFAFAYSPESRSEREPDALADAIDKLCIAVADRGI